MEIEGIEKLTKPQLQAVDGVAALIEELIELRDAHQKLEKRVASTIAAIDGIEIAGSIKPGILTVDKFGGIRRRLTGEGE